MKKLEFFFSFIISITISNIALSQVVVSPKYSTDGEINSVIVSGDKVIYGGNFSSVGVRTGGAATFPFDNNQPDLSFPKPLGEIYSVVSDGNNGLYICGDYYRESEAPSQKHKRIEHILADNSYESNFSFSFEAWGGIKQMIFHGNILYGCGEVSQLGGLTVQGLFGIDVITQTPVNWIPQINSSNGVQVMGILNNIIYFSGNIADVAGLPRTKNAAIEIGTGTVTPWQPDIDGGFSGIGFFQGKAVLCGGFSLTNVGHALATVDVLSGTEVNYLFTDSTLYWAAGVNKICVVDDIVYAFSSGTYDTRITALNLSTGNILWKKYFNMTANAEEILHKDGNLYVAGYWFDETFQTNQDNAPANFESEVGNLFSLNAQTGSLNNWQPDVVGGGSAAHCLSQLNGKLFVGGNFSHVNGFLRKNLYITNLAGDQVLPYSINFDGGQINAMKAIGNTLYVGGFISRLNGQYVDRPIMAFALDVPTLLSWQPAFTGTIFTLENDTTSLYLGGDLTETGGAGRKNLFAINIQNAALQSWSPNPDYAVKSLHLHDNVLYVGGDFANIDGQQRSHVASFAVSDMQLTNWSPVAGGTIDAIASNGNTIWIGGDFFNVNNTNVRSLAGIDAQTGLVTEIPTNAITGGVKTIIAQGKWVIAGGGFHFGVGSPCRNLMMYDSLSHNLVPNNNFCINLENDFYSGVRSMTLNNDIIYFAGLFPKINSNASVSNQSKLVFPSGFFAGVDGTISYYPHSGGNAGSVTMNFFGNQIAAGTHVRFTRAGADDIIVPDDMISYPEVSSMTTVVNFNGAAVGQYNVVVTNPLGVETIFENGFTVEAFVEPVITVQIIAPSLIRTGTKTRFVIQVHNQGNCDAYGVPVFMFVTGNNVASLEGKIFTYDGVEQPQILETPMENYRGNVGITRCYLPLIPKIIANSSYSMSVNVMATDNNGTHSIEAVPSKPTISTDYTLNRSNSSLDINGCLAAIAEEVIKEMINHAPGGNVVLCINSALEMGTSISVGNYNDLGLQLLNTVIDCGSVVAPELGIAKAIYDAASHTSAFVGTYNECKGTNGDGDKHNSESRSSLDPNDKFGTGVKDAHYITGKQSIPYAIRFENIATAGLPAHTVRIEDDIDVSKFDLSTFVLDYVDVAGRQLNNNPARGLSAAYIDMRPQKNMLVKIQYSLDIATGHFIADFSSVDPQNLQPITNLVDGFLNPNVVAPEGEGSIYFSVMPKQDLVSGTVISNTAKIYFDANPPIITPTWNNTIDKLPPVSSVNALPEVSKALEFNLSWSGTDQQSGIEKYDIYYSENNGDYNLLAANVYSNALKFKAKPNTHYDFYCIATDAVGLKESKFATAEASIQIASDDIIVYPNPVTTDLSILVSPGLIVEKVSFIDIQGRKITLPFSISDYETTVSLNGLLSPGFYIVEVKTQEKILFQKIVVR